MRQILEELGPLRGTETAACPLDGVEPARDAERALRRRRADLLVPSGPEWSMITVLLDSF